MVHVRLALKLPKSALLDPARAAPIIQQEVARELTQVTEAMATDVKRDTPVDTGVLRSSIFARVVHEPGRLLGEVASGKQAPYAAEVEYGRKPGHWPARAPIEAWAGRVLGDKRLWFVVARAIYRRGTRGRQMFTHNFARWAPRLPGRVQAAMQRVAKRLEA